MATSNDSEGSARPESSHHAAIGRLKWDADTLDVAKKLIELLHELSTSGKMRKRNLVHVEVARKLNKYCREVLGRNETDPFYHLDKGKVKNKIDSMNAAAKKAYSEGKYQSTGSGFDYEAASEDDPLLARVS